MQAEEKEPDNGLVLLGMGEGFRDELCSMLESAQLLKDFDRDEIETLAHFVGAYAIKKGKYVFREGERGAFMGILVTGRIDIVKSPNKKISIVRPGKTLGEMSVVDGFPYSASALAGEDSTLVYMTKARFEELAWKHPAIGVKLYHQLSRLMSLRLRQTTGILCDFLDAPEHQT
jgi:CRP-like cAMP-binding protein